ncbi:MAG: hypothetical protein LIP02_09865 [Bacteroidales bacterium]|nr:hypothetical protein [Bacteroidales bacterium]
MSKRLLFTLTGLLLALLAQADNYSLGLTPSWGWGYTASEGTITFDYAYAGAAWTIPSDIDITDYKEVVVEFAETPSIGVKLYTWYDDGSTNDDGSAKGVYPETSFTSDNATTTLTLTLDSEWVSGVTYIALQPLDQGEFTISDFYLVPKDDDSSEEVAGTTDYCFDLTTGTCGWSTTFEDNVITMTDANAYGAWQYEIPSDVTLADYASIKLTYSSEYAVKLYLRNSSWNSLAEISSSETGDDLTLSIDVDEEWASSVQAIMIQVNTGTEGATVTLSSLCLLAPEDDDDDTTEEVTPVSLTFSQPSTDNTLYFLPVSEFEEYANPSKVYITLTIDDSQGFGEGWGVGKMYAYNNYTGVFNSDAVPLAAYQFAAKEVTSDGADNVYEYTIKDLKDAACVSSMYYTTTVTDDEENTTTYQGVTINTWGGATLKSIVVYPEANNAEVDNNKNLHFNTCMPDETWYDETTTYTYNSEGGYLEAYLPKAWSSGLLWYAHNLDMRDYADLWIAFAEPISQPLKVSILTTYGFNPEVTIPAGRSDYCFALQNFWFTDVVESEVEVTDDESGETTTKLQFVYDEDSDWGTMMRICLQPTVDETTYKIQNIYLAYTEEPEYDACDAKELTYTDDEDGDRHYLAADQLQDLDDDSLVRLFVYEQQGTTTDTDGNITNYKAYNEFVGTLYKQGYDIENTYVLNQESVWNNGNWQYQAYDHDSWSARGYDFRVHLIKTADDTDPYGNLNHYDFTAGMLKAWLKFDYDSDVLQLESEASTSTDEGSSTALRPKAEETDDTSDDDSSSSDDDTTETLTGSLTFNLWKPWCTIQKIVAVTATGEDKSDLTGIEDVIPTPAIDNTAASVEYYTLQGIRIASPTPGTIVIRRQGTTATKVLY